MSQIPAVAPVGSTEKPTTVQAAPAAVPVSASSATPAVPERILLITSGTATDVPWTGRTPAAKRVRRIFPDAKMMAPDPVLKAGDHITLALFDDVILDAGISNVTRYPDGAVGMTAHLQNGREGTVFLSYCDGQMRASVQMIGGADFCVRYDPTTGAHYAVEVDRKNSVVLEGAEPLIPPANDAAADASAQPIPSEPVVLGDAPAGSTVVGVMVVYTPAALAYEGNVANMNANIALAMQKANEAHTNSNTQVYLNLVHSAEVTYTEENAEADLNNLTYAGGTNGAMDEVQSWRNLYGADLVCLFESTSEVGGLGWLLNSTNGSPNYAFCLARVQQSDWTYTVVHEWGHNMGCSHSKTQTSQPWQSGDLYNYSAGWQWADTKSSASIGYCSIMTYENFDNVVGDEYKRVAYFSNPSINYVGNSTNATGHTTKGDNARTIRNMKTVLAGYRTASSYTVTFNAQGGSAASPASMIVTNGSTYGVLATTARTGYTLGGWWTGTNGMGSQVTSTTTVSIVSNQTLYAKWTANSYTVTFDAQGGSAASPASTNVTYDSTYGTLATTARTGYTLGGWWTGANGTGTEVTSLTTVSITAAQTLYALWTVSYTSQGTPYPWLDQYGLVTGTNYEAAAAEDVDGDGLTAWQEYIAGTNPTNGTSSFNVETFKTLTGGAVIQWSAVSGRVYGVHWATNLMNSFQSLETNIVWPQASYTDTLHDIEIQNFYRINVRLAE